MAGIRAVEGRTKVLWPRRRCTCGEAFNFALALRATLWDYLKRRLSAPRTAVSLHCNMRKEKELEVKGIQTQIPGRIFTIKITHKLDGRS